jgi:hypothetical protein
MKMKQSAEEGLVAKPLGKIPDIDDEHDPLIPEENFLTDYSEENLQAILDEQQELIEWLKSVGKSKHLANRLLIIFDDLVGSNLFSNNRQNAFKMLNTRHRHFSTSLMMVSQAFKEIPKTIRTQFSGFIAFEILSEAELTAIMDEFPMGLKKQDWLNVYEYCVNGDFNFIFYNMQKEKRLRIMKNFDEHVYCSDHDD